MDTKNETQPERKANRIHRPAWQDRLLRLLGLGKGRDAIASTSKHARAQQRPADWRKRRKAARKASERSRRRNRGLR